MQTKPLRIGTRGSPLALAQAHETRDRLMAAHGLPEQAFAIEVISTQGDRVTDRPLSEIGGKGLFTEEIEARLSDGSIDIAVHSSKDMPTVLPDGLDLTAFLPREDVRDAFIGRSVGAIRDLPRGSTIGSSSLRRQALVRHLRPDVNVIPFRGNVQTRLRKLEEGQVDGTLLACAGLKRLGMEHVATDVMESDDFLPALGQGAICIESRSDDAATLKLLAAINHGDTQVELLCERAFLATLDGSCRTPIAGLARVIGQALHFRGMVLSPDGQSRHDASVEGSIADAQALGRDAGERIRKEAGSGFFADWG